MNWTTGLLFSGMLLTAMPVLAQRGRKPPPPQPVRIARTDTSIKNTTLEVYQLYEPELKPIAKPELSPTLPPPPAAHATQQYDVPQQTLYYSYRSLPLRPLALGKDTAAPAAANYALLGGGNLSTILAEVGIGSLRGKDWQSTVQARYITQEGPIKGQQFREFRLGATGSWQHERHLLEAGLDAQYRRYGLYGFNHDQYPYTESDVRRTWSRYGLSIALQNEGKGMWGLDYHPQLTASLFSTTKAGSEESIGLQVPVAKKIDSFLTAELGLRLLLTSLTGNGTPGGLNNNVLQITPGISYRQGLFSGHLGLYPTFSRDGTAYLLPDIAARYQLAKETLEINAGWQAQLVQNTFEQLIRTNPFILPIGQYRQTRSDEVFAGLSVAVAKHLSVWGRVAWCRFSALPLFITDPGEDGKDFLVVYDPEVQAIMWRAGIRYTIGEDFSVGGSGTLANYYTHTYDHVWGTPAARLKGDASWQATQALRITAYMEVLNQIWGLDAQQQNIKLRGVFELGAAGEYTIVQRAALFLRVDNMLGRRNERWLGYPSFGFNIYGGLRYRF